MLEEKEIGACLRDCPLLFQKNNEEDGLVFENFSSLLN